MHQSRKTLNVFLLLGAAGIALTAIIVAVAAFQSDRMPAANDESRRPPQTLQQPNEGADMPRELTAGPPTASPAAPAELGDRIAPPNGTDITEPQGPSGLGTLTIINGTDVDAVAKLIDEDQPEATRRFVYILAGSRTTLRDIGQCTCILRFSLGEDWDTNSRKFLRSQSYSEFEDSLEFTETENEGGIEYSTYEVTLNPVPEGNASTTSIDEDEF